MRPQPLIAVTDVEASSRWYERLLGCESGHGGREYERLVLGGQLLMQLRSFEVEHDHGQIGDPADRPYGNGVLLWFEVDDFDAVMDRAAEMGVEIACRSIGTRRMGRAVRITGSAGYGIRMGMWWWWRARMGRRGAVGGRDAADGGGRNLPGIGKSFRRSTLVRIVPWGKVLVELRARLGIRLAEA